MSRRKRRVGMESEELMRRSAIREQISGSREEPSKLRVNIKPAT
jgi:hypothetical protein